MNDTPRSDATPWSVAIVPTAPLLLPQVSPRQPTALAEPVARLRAATHATLAGLPDVATFLLLAAGPALRLPHGDRVDGAASGHPQLQRQVAVGRAIGDRLRSLLAPAAGGGGAHELRAATREDGTAHGDLLDGGVAVLAALVADARPGAEVVPFEVPVGAAAEDLAAVADAIRAGCEPGAVAVVVAGDLAATREVSSPGYVVDGAVAFDDAVAAAVAAGDLERLEGLGPAQAARVQARGWAPITVGLRLAARPLPQAALHAPAGVGLLVASTASGDRATSR